MKFIAFGDAHTDDKLIMLRPRLPISMQFLEDVDFLAEKHEVGHVFSAGDLWTQKTPSWLVLDSLRKHFKKAELTKGIRYHLLEGNHEALLKSDPKQTFLTLLSEVSDVIITPKVLRIQKTNFFLVPWMPGAKHIRVLEEFAAIASKTKGKKILITHCGLREGWVGSPGNKLNQRMSIRHLFPEEFDLVLIGDYHEHQMMADNALYMGAPIPHRFGENHCVGPWLVNTDGEDITCEPLLLPHRAPEFKEWVIESRKDLRISGYRESDYNRIRCHASVKRDVEILYPGAEVVQLKRTDKPDFSGSRFSKEELASPEQLLAKYMKLKKVSKEDSGAITKIGLSALKEASKS